MTDKIVTIALAIGWIQSDDEFTFPVWKPPKDSRWTGRWYTRAEMPDFTDANDTDEVQTWLRKQGAQFSIHSHNYGKLEYCVTGVYDHIPPFLWTGDDYKQGIVELAYPIAKQVVENERQSTG